MIILYLYLCFLGFAVFLKVIGLVIELLVWVSEKTNPKPETPVKKSKSSITLRDIRTGQYKTYEDGYAIHRTRPKNVKNN